jgi:hypothetical protein
MLTGSGSARRRRARLICCIMAGALLVFALGATSAEAKTKKVKHHYYLALGDSISYGYSLVKFDENLTAECATKPAEGTCEPPTAFEPGFENYIFGKVTKKGIKPSKKESTINLSCPGETSTGLIGHNGALGGGAGAEFNPCGWHNTDHFRRHEEYGTISQVEAAMGLMTGNAEHNPEAINLVSINIGSNDELHVLGECRSEAYRTAHSFSSESECVEHEAPALFGKILSNIGHTIGDLRAAGYKGDVVVLGFYNPFGVLSHATDALQEALNHELEKTVSEGLYGPGVKVANPFMTFNAGGVGGATEKSALETNTEFYNPAAIADELASITASEELNHHPNLAEATAFTEAYGQCSAKLAEATHRFEDALCTKEQSHHEGEYERVNPNLAEVLAFEEAHASPANLAETTAYEEAHGSPNLAETEAFEEASGSPNLAETEAFEEASGSPNLAETEAFEEAHGSPDLAESIAAHEAEAHAGFVGECETHGGTHEQCEEKWTTEGKPGYEAAVKTSFDEAVEAGFDEAVEAGFDSAVKAGYDAAVKKAFDSTFEFFFRATVKHAFDEQVKAGFEAAGSPGDIHPSKVGYAALGSLIKANK